MASPVGGRRLAAPSDLDPAEENAVVRAVLSRISGPRVTSTVKKQKPRAAEDADAGDAPADDAPLAFAAERLCIEGGDRDGTPETRGGDRRVRRGVPGAPTRGRQAQRR